MTRKLIEFGGDARTLTEWSEHFGVATGQLSLRITRMGVERAFTTPFPTKRSVEEIRAARKRQNQARAEQRRECAPPPSPAPEEDIYDRIGREIGLSREGARIAYNAAMAKLRIGHRLIEVTGVDTAEVILMDLKGKSIRAYRRALRDAVSQSLAAKARRSTGHRGL